LTHILLRQAHFYCRLALILVKTAYIAGATLFYLPLLNSNHKQKLIHSWIDGYLGLLGVSGQLVNSDILPTQPFMLVANHISWLDFFVLQSLYPARVVAKAEVSRIPFVGSLAKAIGIIYTDRHRTFSVKQTISDIARVLQTESVCIFPEGTTHISYQIMPFKPTLLQSAVDADVPVIPLAIKYVEMATGNKTNAPAYFHVSFGTTLVQILRNQPIKAIFEVCPPAANGLNRGELANYCHSTIIDSLSLNY
jgi:1-acyl-sn-glycerol-3-phosphate acyltransferase